MVAESGGTCTVVRAVDRRGDRQACWQLVEAGEVVIGDVRGDGSIVEGEVVRATVGLVRMAEPGAGCPAVPGRRGDRERYRLIVQLHGNEQGGKRLPVVVLDVVAVTMADQMADQIDEPVALQDMRRGKLVERIRMFIESQLGDPQLSPAAVAAAHHISLRYLHKLFEPEPCGVAGLIRQRRLERCRDDLLDPAQADRPVAGIAARWGFSSAAHFSRVFREAYGLPPAEFRRAYRLSEAS
jgi:AraC-like DNA-binding protein